MTPVQLHVTNYFELDDIDNLPMLSAFNPWYYVSCPTVRSRFLKEAREKQRNVLLSVCLVSRQ
jgi:hypothetical protein